MYLFSPGDERLLIRENKTRTREIKQEKRVCTHGLTGEITQPASHGLGLYSHSLSLILAHFNLNRPSPLLTSCSSQTHISKSFNYEINSTTHLHTSHNTSFLGNTFKYAYILYAALPGLTARQ